jgi:hypothetical protein
MNHVFAYLFRFTIIIGGYLVGSLAASAFLNVLMLGALGFIGGETSPAAGSLIFSIPFVALFVAYFAFMPAILAILAGEIFGKRDWLFYAIAGAVVALIIVGFMRGAAEASGEAATDLNFVLAVVGSGMCGGIGYWLVAGRSAGRWRRTSEAAGGAGRTAT